MRKHQAQKLLEHVKKSYNQIADEFSDSRVRPWEEFKYFKPYLKGGMKIVDLGCGNGRLLDFLAPEYLIHGPKAFEYVGIDNSENLLKNARRKHPEALFVEGDQLEIPLKDEEVDLIFNIAAFHHIPSKVLRLKALREMRRALKKNGYLIVTVWNLWQRKYLKAILKAFFSSIVSLGNLAPNDLFISWGKAKNDEKTVLRYYHAFIPSELLKLFKKADFEIVEAFSVKKGVKVPFLKSFNFCIIAKKRDITEAKNS